MKSDVIRKRARQEARKGSSASDTPSASPGNSARASPVTGPGSGEQHHAGTLSSTFDFSASAFEFSQVTPDTTDRLTHQHEPHDTNGFNSALSPGTTSYLDHLQLQYPTSQTGSHTDNHHEVHPFDLATNFEQAFQDDGSKRRRVSPDSDLEHAVTSSSSASIASSLLSASSSDQTDATSFGSHSPVFDPFNPYFPYTFSFAPTPSGWTQPNLTYPLPEEEPNDLLAGRQDAAFQAGSMEDTSSL